MPTYLGFKSVFSFVLLSCPDFLFISFLKWDLKCFIFPLYYYSNLPLKINMQGSQNFKLNLYPPPLIPLPLPPRHYSHTYSIPNTTPILSPLFGIHKRPPPFQHLLACSYSHSLFSTWSHLPSRNILENFFQ